MHFTIYCINLDSRPDRWDSIMKQFSGIPEVDLVRVPAIEHKYGHIGCSLSHAKVMDNYLGSAKEIMVVIEDDCLIKNLEQFPERIQNIVQWLISNSHSWEIFNGNPSNIIPQTHYEILDDKLEIVKYWPIPKGGTANFIIYNTNNPNVARRMLAFPKMVYSYLDKMDRGLVRINRSYKQTPIIDKYLSSTFVCITSVPYLTSQISSFSNTENRHADNEAVLNESDRIMCELVKPKIPNGP